MISFKTPLSLLTFSSLSLLFAQQPQQPMMLNRPMRAVVDEHLKVDRLVADIDSLRLVQNRVYLLRQTADALNPGDRPEAAQLLLHALSEIDSAELTLRSQEQPDQSQIDRLDFSKRPVLLQLVRIDPVQGLQMVELPQPADDDMEFQRLIYEQIAVSDTAAVSASALRKLGIGVTPAVVAAYSVLQRRDPGTAKTLAIDIVARLRQQDPGKDQEAVHAAFALLRLLRSDQGTRAPQITINPSRLDDASIRTLFAFIGDSLLAAKEPEMLVLPEAPKLYVSALEKYAPTQADQVKLLPFAAPDAKSLLLSKPLTDSQQASVPTPTVEEIRQQAIQQQQFQAQLKETAESFHQAQEAIDAGSLSAENAGKTVSAAMDEANKSISLARSFATTLKPSEFQEGEFDLTSGGPLTGVVASASSLLRSYAKQSPEAALNEAQQLDGAEVQIALMINLEMKAANKPTFSSVQPQALTGNH